MTAVARGPLRALVVGATCCLTLLALGCGGPADDVAPTAAPGATAAPGPDPDPGSRTTSSARPGFEAPPPGGRFSYQLGGAYPPSAGVDVLARDRTEDPDPTIYSICYVNAFQAQPDSVGWWQAEHPDLLLRDAGGALVVDRDWGEPLLDISTDASREELMRVLGPRVQGCAASGFLAVEPDNLDSWTRSGGLLTDEDALAMAALLIERAHASGLAIAQKNAAELTPRARAAGFDFAIAEECQVHDECEAYVDAYGAALLEVEYTDQARSAFEDACRAREDIASVTLRDRELAPAGAAGHVEQWCD